MTARFSQKRAGARKRSEAEPLTRELLEDAAVRYLDRFDASVAKLEQVLARKVMRAERSGLVDATVAAAWIQELTTRFRASGLLNDERYASALVDGFRSRGTSRKAIGQKLRARGVSLDTIDAALRAHEHQTPEAEWEASCKLVRKRKLGPFRPPEQRARFRRKDLATLARAGFGYDIARRALGPTDDDDTF